METDSLGVAPQRPPRRKLGQIPRRWGAVSAAVLTAALLAGCGTASSSGSSTSAGTSPTGTNASAFNPNLVPAAGTSAGAAAKPKGKAAAKKTAKVKGSQKKPGKSPSSKSSVFSPAATNPAPTPAPAPAPTPSATAGSSGGTRTVTVSHTSTVTVTKYVHIRPKVPAGAGLPSAHKPASVSRFDAAHGNIGCRIEGGIVRCDIAHRVWTPPHKPSSCHAAWAQGLLIGSSGSTSFVCGRSSVLDPTGYYMRPGYDDKVGSVTCQVRSFGVTCFQSDGHGFFVGRTGYTTF